MAEFPGATIYTLIAQWKSRFLDMEEVGGSNPPEGTI